MQPLDDDMEDLFKRAAEEYPLDTSGADWNKVKQELHHEKGVVAEEVSRKRDYRFLWLLFLLPIGFICGRYIGNDKMAASVETNRTVDIQSDPANNTPSLGSNPKIGNVESRKKESETEAIAGNGKGEVTKSAGSSNEVNLISGSKAIKGVKMSKASLAGEGALAVNTALITKRKKLAGKSLSSQTSAPKSINATGEESPTTTTADLDKATASSTQSQVITDSSKKENTPENVVTKNGEGLSTPPASKETKNIKKPPFKKTLSFSIVAGPDVSTVKLQKTSKVGYSLGVMLRYQFARRISVEGGALWDRKNYYTDGKYLDTAFLKLPMHSEVKNATGYCDMIEIPINMRYDFAGTQKHSWFVSGGISSYIMSREDYNVSYNRYNVSYRKDYEYMQSTRDWFSIMNLSVGYQKSLGKYTNISVAPYVKLPLKQVGIGKLPVSSTGIFLSLSRSFK
ncbi:PorT family protein [Segetibacter aerophilus]|uniref:Outer membrane protein beta-barrel domain-containing protein n=1 Tax=Segetibacter aerophilus TaxID=670293 RepID=A0A512BCH4_9BACT|nr:PorT family protein [Segetibacter aerophilus]GEO09662.1 hypothetical protein SAE01_21580 [Segetibacter aerophilus]